MPARKTLVATRLKELRTQANLTQAALGERSRRSHRHHPLCRRAPGKPTIQKLAEGLGVALTAFDPRPELPNQKRRKGA